MKLNYDLGARLGFPRDKASRANAVLLERVDKLEREVEDLRRQLLPFRRLG